MRVWSERSRSRAPLRHACRTGFPLTLAAALLTACGSAGNGRVEEVTAAVDRYCVECHNDVEQTGGLTLEGLSLADVTEHADVWEEVVHKLRGRMMPPAGGTLPELATTDGIAAYLETALDEAAEASPNPGRKLLHRLNRTEYGNAIRDLLALEIDATALLPNDSEAYGFDNIADVLGTDPSLMDRYLSAAWKITTAAIGDVNMTPSVVTYEVPGDRSQTDHVEGLPFGTRGGLLVRHFFPVDGEYVIQPQLWTNTVGILRGMEQTHDVEISLDGKRLALVTVGGTEDRRQTQNYPGIALADINARLRVRTEVPAGHHDVGVTFVKKSSASRQEVLQSFDRDKLDPRLDNGIAELAHFSIEGPFNVTGPGDSASRKRIFSCYPSGDDAAEAAACARDLLGKLARRAYRRPVTDSELERLMSLYASEIEKGRGFEAGVQTALAYVLVAPQFLFRVEEDPADVAPGELYRISDLELASRLSFFLWSSIPDDELIDAAAAGRLSDPDVLERQVGRMLADERASSLARDFAGQWLYLRNLRAATPDMVVYPDFDDNLRQSMIRETELLFESIVREDRPITELLSADYTFMNGRLAEHYGISDIYGDQFRRVPVNDERRKGLLGHASILTLTAYPNRTSPVTRGSYVLTNILGTPPPEPPPDVPALPEATGEKLSMRERMARHREDSACAGCHALMDPIGLVLESYDGIGVWRTEDNGEPIVGYGDPIHVLRDYGPIVGPVDLRKAILAQSERFVHTAAEKLLTYALGRGLEYYDMPTVRTIVREAAASDYRFSALVLAVIESEPFQMRIADTDKGTAIALNSAE